MKSRNPEAPSGFERRFELKSAAGTGGMGTVFQAIDRQTGAVVAVKILNVHSETEMARFDQEARMLAELSHPGIVRYVDHGVASHGSPYIAMEWLEGETLEVRLSRGTLGPAAVAHLAAGVLEALSAAHQLGVVHRDIKPSNVFLVNWRLTEIRILDFGIARRQHDPKRFTRKGSTVGTPLYTSPEQARGRHDVDGRADIFSLGCVIYEALSGDTPFNGETAIEVMTKVCAGRAAPITARRPDLPAELVELIHRMLEPDPNCRPQSAKTLAAQFRSLAGSFGGLNEEMAASKPPPVTRREGISEVEERVMSCLLVSLARRNGTDTSPRSIRERRLGPRSAFLWPPDVNEAPVADDVPERLAVLEQAVRPLGGEIDRLIDRTLLVTAPAQGAAREQATQLARAALLIRDFEPDGKMALGSGRAAFAGRVPSGRLMDMLPLLMRDQEAGTIRVDETTRRLLPNRFVLNPVAGIAQLYAETSGATEHPGSGSRVLSPFLGRQREIATMEWVRRECFDESASRALLVVAGLGIGKTRVVREFLSAHHEGSIIRCVGSISQMEVAGALLAPLMAAAGIEADASQSQREILQACAGWLRQKTHHGPVTLVLDDMQWADPVSVQMVDEMLALLSNRPFLVVASGRPEVEERFPGVWSDRSVEYVRLLPLSRKAGQSILQTRAPGVGPEIEAVLLERWEGNPLFLEEMTLAVASGQSGVPEIVLAVIEGRLDVLSSEARRVLRAASLYGDAPFSAEALVAILGESSRRQISECLETLVMRDFLSGHPHGTEFVYTITHPLVREAANRMLPAEERLRGRRLARAWLQQLGESLPLCLASPASQTGKVAVR